MLIALAPLVVSLASSPIAAAQEDALVSRDWLVLERIDARGRRPFRPDAVLREHVLPGRAPEAGQELEGERSADAWDAAEANDKGRLGGSIGYAYTRVEVPETQVRLAKLTGASTLIVNGRAYAGDLYGYGWGGLPVALNAGANDVYVSGVRGAFTLRFEAPAAALEPGRFSHTLPDLVIGEAPLAELGLCVRNATEAWVAPLTVEVRSASWVEREGEALEAPEPLALARTRQVLDEGLAPLGVRNVAVRIAPAEPETRLMHEGVIALEVVYAGPGLDPVTETVKLRVRTLLAHRNRTYRSEVDGSVQLYSMKPATGKAGLGKPSEGGEPGLVLSLHGAGVHAPSQTGSYSFKEDLWVVAPTNRSRFGFDWQDWGRRDAYDVLAHALEESGVDRRRVYLTGHSMGGHGTWHLGANDPDGFAAIAPSAGWQSFDTYGSRPEGELRELWHRADASSRTVDLLANLVQTPTFVLHGDADDNVPASEARDMIALLEDAGGRPLSHFEPGKGHWWNGPVAEGADCVDWPGIMELFRASAIPTDPAEIDFTTVDPGTDAAHHWVRVLQQLEPGRPSRVRGALSEAGGRVELTTENVRAFELIGPAASASQVTVDGAIATLGDGAARRLVRDGVWRVALRAEAIGPEKTPERMGPLKRGFDRRFLLVVPTAGDAEENGAALARARFDADVWWYRANGDAPIVTDAEWLAWRERYRGRNVVLYGNADTNRAWSAALPASAPVDVRRGSVSLRAGGGMPRRFEGDALDALFVYPQLDDEEGLVVALASTGAAADRRASALALFVSGVGYADFAVVGPEVLSEGDGGVLAAGFFDHAWR